MLLRGEGLKGILDERVRELVEGGAEHGAAGAPSFVPGILMNTFGLAARTNRSLASRSVLAVSCASRGETSSDTRPSTPSVLSCTGRNRSAAWLMSASARSKKSASPDFP